MTFETFCTELLSLIDTIEEKNKTFVDRVYRNIGANEVLIRHRAKKRFTISFAGHKFTEKLLSIEVKTGFVLEDIFFDSISGTVSIWCNDVDQKQKKYSRFKMEAKP